MDKYIFKFSVLIMFLVFLYGCSDGGIYKSDNYSFEVPDGWKKIEIGGGNAGFVDSTGSRLLLFNSVDLGSTSYSDALNGIKIKQENLKNFKLLSEESLVLSGRDANKFTYYYEGGPEEQFKRGIVAVNDNSKNRLILFTFTTYQGFYDKDVIVLQNAISTLNFD